MHMQFTLLKRCLDTCTWIDPITFCATLPDSGCGYALSESNRLLGPIVLRRSVIPVILMTYKMNNMCRPDAPISRSALSVK
eukprot:781907-Pelagomonas_calceolata.AAC.1